MAQVTTVLMPRRSASFKLRAYVALTKPRIIELLLVTALPTRVVAAKGIPGWWLIVATLVGGTLSAGGANAANMFVDRDIDAVMHRTRHRPIVTGAVTPTAAVLFSIVLEADRVLPLSHASPADRHRGGHSDGCGHLLDRPRGCCIPAALAGGQSLLGSARARSSALLRFRLLDRPEAPLDPEHRHRRRRRGGPGARRLDRGHRPPCLACHRAVCDDRDLDAVTLLGPGGALSGRLQGGERPDVAGGGALRTGGAPDHLVLAGVGRHVLRVRCRRSLWVDLLGSGRPRRRPLPRRRLALASRERDTEKRHAPVHVLDHLHHRGLRGDGGRRDRPLPLTLSAPAGRLHSHLKVTAATTGAATAQRASTTQASVALAPDPSVLCSASDSAAVGSRRAKEARLPSSCNGKMTPPMSSRIT